MPDIQKVNRVDIGNIERVNRVAGSNIEQLDGQEFVTFTPATYTFNSTDSSWAIPAGTNHFDITVVGGGGTGSYKTNISWAGFGGGGSGASQSTENTGGRVARSSILSLIHI